MEHKDSKHKSLWLQIRVSESEKELVNSVSAAMKKTISEATLALFTQADNSIKERES
jgi:hypothetical protein